LAFSSRPDRGVFFRFTASFAAFASLFRDEILLRDTLVGLLRDDTFGII